MPREDYFPFPLDLRDAGMRGESRLFELLGPFWYRSSLGIIVVPAGFVTDGASIPRAFWAVLTPFGNYFEAAVIHDFLYSANNRVFTRLQADTIFKEAMYNVGLGWVRRETIYRAVRLFGGSFYQGKRP